MSCTGDVTHVADVADGFAVAAIVAPDGEWITDEIRESYSVTYHEVPHAPFTGRYAVLRFRREDALPVMQEGTQLRDILTKSLKGVRHAFAAVLMPPASPNGWPNKLVETGEWNLSALPSTTLDEFRRNKAEITKDGPVPFRLVTKPCDAAPRPLGFRVFMWDVVPSCFRDLLWPTGIPVLMTSAM